jgi:capsular exopolysaccharide synthesis family protein
VDTQPEPQDFDQQDAAIRSGPSLLQIAWQRKSLVILGVMVGVILGFLYYAQKQPVYQSMTQLLVVKKTPMDSLSLSQTDRGVAYMEDYMGTQQVLIRSPEIVTRAVKQPSLQDLQSYPEKGDELAYIIRDSLTVVRDSKEGAGTQNNILTLSFRGPVADECPKIVRAVTESYQNFLNETYQNVSNKTLELINQARDALDGSLARKQQEYHDFKLRNPHVLIRGAQGTTNIYAERLAKVEQRRADIKLKKTELTDRLARIEEVYKKQGKQAAMTMIQACGVKIQLFAGSEEVEKTLMQLKVARKKHLSIYGESHPYVKEIDDHMAMLMEDYGRGTAVAPAADPAADPAAGNGAGNGNAAAGNGPPAAGGPTLPTKIRDLGNVESYLTAMRAEIADADTLIQALDNLFDAESKLARDLSSYEAQDERYKDSIASARKLFDSIVNRLHEINLVKDFGGYEAKPIAPPGLGRKVSPNPYQVFPVAGLAGLLAGLCLAYLAELSDKSFRTPTEIRRRLGLPVIGHIPFFAPDEKAAKQIAAGEPVVDPMLCTHYQSSSISSEAYRSVRTALYFNTHGVGHQVIQVTSPNVSDGKSTLAANLAVSIAQSGKRTIIIDADCRRPRVHKIFNVPADAGLAGVIAGHTDLASAIKPSAVPNLSVMPCGPRPANPAELLTSPRFKELLDLIRAQYDFVIVDTPPLLVVTDPCVVAPRVDGVVLAIRVTKNGRPFAERAKEVLVSLGANILGVVVNGLGSPAGGRYGYGYDQYQYGYGYTYRYSYTYTDEYTDDKAASYYTNSPADAPPDAPAGK